MSEELQEVVSFREKDLHLQAFPMMESIRRQGKLCDVTLKVGEQKLSAHRIVLASTIPYFTAMFTHDMMEARQDEIVMQGIDSGAMASLVNYAYSGHVSIDINNVQSLLIGASYLHIQNVKDACCEFLEHRLHPHNVLGIRSFAEQYMCYSLVDATKTFIQRHFQSVVNHDSFSSLTLQEVIDIMMQDQLHVQSEEQVFEAIVRWVDHDRETRKDALPQLLVCVRLPLLTPQYLSDRVATEDLIKNSLSCRDLLDEAKDYHLMPERRSFMQTFKTRQRCCLHLAGVIYAMGGLTSTGDSISTVECYDQLSNKWKTTQPMNTMRSRVGAAVVKNCLYAIGGYDGQERLNTVERYNPKDGTWTKVAAMNCKRSAVGVVTLDNRIYVCGGYNGISSLNSMEMYEPDTDKWSLLPEMMKHRSASGMTVLDAEIYMCGGHDGLSLYDSVECYNIATTKWRSVPPMLSKRCRLGVATVGGQLYAAGGYDGTTFLRSVETYNPASRQWTMVCLMGVKRSRVALTSMSGRLYAIGGYDGVSNLKSMEMYSPEDDKWTFLPDMKAHEGGVGVAVIPYEDEYPPNDLFG